MLRNSPEEFCRQNAAAEELQRFRLGVFASLMKHRSEILAPDARAAINLVDVAFSNVPEVRDARRLFLEATRATPNHPVTIVERNHALIEAVARATDFGSLISGFDVRSGYYPEAIGKLDEAALVEAEDKIARRAIAEKGRPQD